MSDRIKISTNFDDNHWRQNYGSCLYIEKGSCYENYQSAYQIGHEGYDRYPDKSFDEAELELKLDYEALSAQKGGISFDWDKAKDAVRDAWDRAGTT
ncbi:hypothetical protein TUMEXPCC7403_24215 [Tumidithrix helvetica PCC 7403]|uniref:hypothetical protein n=1 Tax=Tumidithrix helvetica TaxID=3457545 RepID=UPI003C8738E5